MRATRNGLAGILLAAFALAEPSAAQQRAQNETYSMIPEARDETVEDRTANAGESVIIHYNSDVHYLSALQFVIMVQEYYRRGYRRFIVPIQTRGGDINAAMYAYETLSQMPVDISTVAIGRVDSAGLVLYCLGDKRYASPSSSFLFHPMRGTVDSNRRSQEAAQVQIESLNAWIDSVETVCFGETPEKWDLERRDYRATADEASAIGLVNAGANYLEEAGEIGEVSYVLPVFFSDYDTGR